MSSIGISELIIIGGVCLFAIIAGIGIIALIVMKGKSKES